MAGSAANLSARAAQGWGALARALGLVGALMALLLQANAPVHATLMEFAGEGTYALCAEHTTGQESDRKAPPARREACAACAVCAFTGGPALAASPAVVLPVLALVAVLGLSMPREVAPRAPPRRKRRARAPPAYA